MTLSTATGCERQAHPWPRDTRRLHRFRALWQGHGPTFRETIAAVLPNVLPMDTTWKSVRLSRACSAAAGIGACEADQRERDYPRAEGQRRV